MDNFELDGITFLLDTGPGDLRGKSAEDSFVLVKTREMLAFYEQLREKAPKTILEIGMFQGGSMVYFDKLFHPTSLVGVDITKKPIAALEAYRQSRDHIKTYYGRSQDSATTRGAAQSNFPGGIDLVVDDASHHYELSKTTFENIFPMVKPGGTYIIEDWAWSHRAPYQAADAVWHTEPALSNLIINLVLMTAVSRVVESVMVLGSLVAVTKGKGVLPAGKLDLSGHLRGKDLPLI